MENIMKNLNMTISTKFSGKTTEVIKKDLIKPENCIYIFGLDCHVGFVYNDGKTLKFIHSSYYDPPYCVVSEDIDTKNPLKDSEYRSFGKLFNQLAE